MREYRTSDLQLAAFLTARGHDPIRVEGPPPRRCFVFAAAAQDDVSGYYNGAYPLPPLSLFAAYRRLKRRLFDPAS
jgi:hypothetical protein